MPPASLADEFPFRFRNLLIETIFVSMLFGFAIISSKLLDELIFILEGFALLLIAIVFELIWGGQESEAKALIARAEEEAKQSGTTYGAHQSTFMKVTEEGTVPAAHTLEADALIDKRLSRNITKAFSLSTIVLWLIAGLGTTDNAVVRQVSSIAFIVVVLFLPFGMFLGLLQAMRSPRVSTSRAFGAYINLGVLLVGIPMFMFLFFVVGSVILLVLVPPSSDPAQILLSTLLVAILLTAVIQVYFIVSTLQKAADYHGLSISGYIALKLSQEEKEQERQAKIARAEKVDELYSAIPAMKKKIKPWAKERAEPISRIDMSQYEYAPKSSKLGAILRELGPPLLAVFLSNLVFIAFLLMLSSLQGS
ncbi:MAG: hypothetical protein ACE5OZ_07880 [Candidatus Heimdallarchaeota archaeon]